MTERHIKNQPIEGTPPFESFMVLDEENDNKVIGQVVIFDSIGDLVQTTTMNEKAGWVKGKESGEDGWTYGAGMNKEKTDYCLTSGIVMDTKMVDDIDKHKMNLQNNYPQLQELERSALLLKKKRIRREEGDELCIDSYLCGDPQMWFKMHKTKDKKAFRVMLNVGASAGINAEQFTSEASLYVAMIDIIQSSGVPCEVYVGAAQTESTRESGQSFTIAKVKAAEEPLDIHRLLSVGYSGFFRDHVFSILKNVLKGQVSWGLGCPLHAGYRKEMTDVLDFNVIVSGSNFDEKAKIFIDGVTEFINSQTKELN